MPSLNTNMAALSVLTNINKTDSMMSKTLQQLSTGFRINGASDGASEFAISSKLEAQKGALGAASSNAAQGSAMVKMAEGGAKQIQVMLERLKVLATTASSASSATALAPLDAERVKLEDQITKIAQGLTYNGVKLLDGTGGVASFQTGVSNAAFDKTTVAFNNAYDATSLGLGKVATAAVAGVGGGAGTAASTTGTFATTTDAQAYMATIDAALSTVIANRADLGSTINVLKYVSNNIATSIEQLSSSISTIKDADVAALTAKKAKYQVQQQAQLAMLVQANSSQQNLLTLFR